MSLRLLHSGGQVKLSVRDEKSTNGTKVNGKRVPVYRYIIYTHIYYSSSHLHISV